MWRAFFLAIGISLCILGGECMILEKAVLAGPSASSQAAAAPSAREIKPPEWAPWSLLSAGAIVILYSCTIPRRGAG